MDDIDANTTANFSSCAVADVHVVVLNILCGIPFVIGIPSNSLVILAVILSKKLRTTTNVFVVNLSIADLLTCLTIPAFVVCVDLEFCMWDKLLYALDGALCLGSVFVISTSLGCSLFSLFSIALNRLLLITRPLTTYRKIYTPKKIAVWLVLTWFMCLGSLCIAVLPVQKGSTTGEQGVAIVIIPVHLIAIGVCYVLLWRHIKRHTWIMARSRKVPNGTPAGSSTMTALSNTKRTLSPSPIGANTIMAGHSQLSRHQSEITKNMFYVVCASVLCIGPYGVCLFLDVDGHSIVAKQYAFVMLLFNSCVNPLIYAAKHRDFKTVFGCIVRRQWEDIPEPSDFLKAMRRRKCCGRRNPSV
ncbi:melatonin-related receptor-like [Acanthaster planci]|uniref:Melatonin-related receptor-like n=1 Tax=Acanthaster planci TaxID=133434 RepID=A0A8B7XGR7_ACAPL|nr:melatonin-related receptor-like [Acanthaster planci]